ncbi:MAG: putative endonuclease 4 [Parcubacteria group bacterium GW2011_GWF2_38_76]|nr:MAG: putative endonuclease 4 [Parcubacteria group bacterium GW2011_GWF2_38_76]
MKFGAHVSTRQPFSEAVNRAKEIGCECMQIFANPPQRWNPLVIPEEEIARFKDLNAKAPISPVIIHGIYLLNLASSNTYFYKQSIASLINDMQKASKLGALGVNFHVGSTKGAEMKEVMHKVKDAVKEILDGSPEGPYLIIENSAGAGNIIGDTIEEIAEIIGACKSNRVKSLIDTAHAFESGYDIKSKAGLEKFINKFDSLIGLGNLVGFHINDSKTELNSKRDRHADIGKGYIGLEAIENIVTHQKLQDKCAILETPQDEMDWPTQLNILKEMRSSQS